jgi:hypothetical protein
VTMSKARPISDAMFRAIEKLYLEPAADEQKNEYSQMTKRDKAKTLIAFVSGLPKARGSKPWRAMMVAMLSRAAATED